MPPLTEDQTNSFMEKIGEIFDIPLFTKTDTNRLLTRANESMQWVARTKEQLTKAGLGLSMDQIALLPCNPVTNNSIVPVQTLAPVFSLYNLGVSKENLTTLLDKIISASKKPLSKDCVSYTAPFPRNFYTLDEVRTLHPEYLTGTWFNRQEKAFKFNMDVLDWVIRKNGTECFLPATPMCVGLFASTGEHIYDYISEVHVHPTAMTELNEPARDGWIEAPGVDIWRYEAADSAISFFERVMKVKGARTIVQLNSGLGGWATFECVRDSEVTAAAARLLFKFSDPLYCARSDGKVVIKLKGAVSRALLLDNKVFPTARVLLNERNKFPSCIP